MHFLETLWESIQPELTRILDHPFNTELAKGTLPAEKFRFYIIQDSIYIENYTRATSILASKAPDESTMLKFVQYAYEGLKIERNMHEKYREQLGTAENIQPSLATEAYANFLLTTILLNNFEIGLACFLPCFWVYHEMGKHIFNQAQPGNPYKEWINTYSGKEFDASVHQMKEMTAQLARQTDQKTREKMKDAFIHSTRYGLLFHDYAYQMKIW